MSNLTNQHKATYALLADNVYWDVRYGYKDEGIDGYDFSNSNWTPVPEGWTVLTKEIKDDNGIVTGVEPFEVYSSTQYPELNDIHKGFTARAYQKEGSNEVVISFAVTEPEDINDWLYGNLTGGIGKATLTKGAAHLTQSVP